MEDNIERSELFVKQILTLQDATIRLTADQCFYCETDKPVDYCMQFPCNQCVMICPDCIEDALTICECQECFQSSKRIIQYEFDSITKTWSLGATQYSSDEIADFQRVSDDDI